MSILQKNVFGDNIIYHVSPDFSRQLTEDLKNEIITALKTFGVSCVTIRYEHTAETAEYVTNVGQFLQQNGFTVHSTQVMMSEIQRNEFSIEKHPSDPNFAKIKIGPLL